MIYLVVISLVDLMHHTISKNQGIDNHSMYQGSYNSVSQRQALYNNVADYLNLPNIEHCKAEYKWQALIDKISSRRCIFTLLSCMIPDLMWLTLLYLMSDSTTSQSMSVLLIPNITQFISFKLDNSNYLLWVSQFLPVLHTHDLLGIVNN